MQGVLFIVCGPSGVGKSSLCRELLATSPRARFSVSYTTRAPRGAEVDGVAYHFIDKARFEAMVEAGEFAEWAEVHGNYYGSGRAVVEGALAEGQDLFFDIDYQGAAQLRAAFPSAVSVMIAPPSMTELERRLRGRETDSEAVIARRLAKARLELSQFEDFDYVIINDDLEAARTAFRAIYEASRYRKVLQRPAIGALLGIEGGNS